MKQQRAQIDTWLAERFRSDPEAWRLAAQVSDDEWALLRTYPDLAEATVPTLGDRVRLMRGLYARTSVASNELETTVTELRSSREHALADILARHVTRDARFGVTPFRQEVLGGVLVSADGVAEWIEARKIESGMPVEYMTIRPDGTAQTRRRVLRYARPASDATFTVATMVGSELERLRSVSAEVASFCNWSEAASTEFVLTGQVPHMATVTGALIDRSPLSARSRIVLTIDPSCTPSEVELGYRRYRAVHFRRIRRLKPSRAQLAAFAHENAGLPWARIRDRWRERQPKLVGASVADFRRQALHALRTLTELPLKRTAPPSSESVIAPPAMTERNQTISGDKEPSSSLQPPSN